MELPLQGNKHVIVFQDFLTKWPKFLKHPCQTGNKLAVPSYARHLQKTLQLIIHSVTVWWSDLIAP